jgi:predicted alpha/beta hydrolase
VTSLAGGTGAQLPCKFYREWRSQFSYPSITSEATMRKLTPRGRRK